MYSMLKKLCLLVLFLNFIIIANSSLAEGPAAVSGAAPSVSMGGAAPSAAMGGAMGTIGGAPAMTAPAANSAIAPQGGNNAPGTSSLTAPLSTTGSSMLVAPTATNNTAINQTTGVTTQNQQAPNQSTTVDATAAQNLANQQAGKDLANTLLNNAAEVSSLEQAMNGDGSESDKASPQKAKLKPIQQFGYSFFRPGADNFAALNDIPVAPDYVLGTGDRINLSVWGSLEGSYELEINRNGEITLPKVGAVKLSGTTFEKLPQVLKGQLGKVFKDFNLNVSMGKLRLIKVYVVGQVKSPGDYSISSLSTLINALSAAGGPTRNGSLRSIAIRRNGKLVDTVDLYEFFLNGDKSRDIRLQTGDTIFIPSIGPVAGIAGNVRRPAIYELKNEKTLKDLLTLADGIVPTGYLQRLQISRVDAYQKKSVTDVNLDPATSGKTLEKMADTIAIKDMDMVKIFPIDSTLRGYVRLDGYVLRPGDYAIKPGMKLSDVLTMDNLLPEYYQSVGRIIRLMPPDFHPEILLFHPANAADKKPGFDLALQEFDTVQMFSRWEMEEMPTVVVSGEVQKPGKYRLFDKMTVRDLLYSAGNTKLTAYLKNAELIRTHRTGDRVTSSTTTIDLASALMGDPKSNLTLEPYDELLIRRIPYWAEETDKYITITGEVLFPGVYPILRGERLSNVLKRAGGFTDKAYTFAAKFTRVSVQKRQQKQMDESIARLEEEISQQQSSLASSATSPEELSAIKASLSGLQSTITKMKALKAEGRMVIRISNPDEMKGKFDDIELEGGDMISVPPRSASVSVLGKVFNPTNPLVIPGESVSYYLNKAGGVTNEADSSDIYVLRADGSVDSRQQDIWITRLFGGGLLGKDMNPGDTIVVPPRIEKSAWLRDLKDWTTILSQVAITAGTVLLGLR